MQMRFSFIHMESSEALSEYAGTKIRQKVEKFSTKPIETHVTFTVEGHTHKAHCNVTGGDGFNCQVEATCEDMYGSVDLMLDKLETQLKKQKEKLKNHKRTNGKTLKQIEPTETESKDDCDTVPVDADDVIKFDRARALATK